MISYKTKIKNHSLRSFIELKCPKCGCLFTKNLWKTQQITYGSCPAKNCEYVGEEENFKEEK